MSTRDSNLSHPKYRPDIDGLRAIAVLSVLGFHAFGVMGGFTGVDIFFVISGFLISTIIFENLENNSFSFNQFYQRRIRRIFPSLLLVLFSCLFFGWFVLFADEYEQLGKHTAAGAGFIANLVLWGESGYFDIAAEKKPLLHLWSLGIEEQFYFFWPIFGWLLWKFRAHFLWIALLITGISFGLNIYLVGTDSVATFYSPWTRFWELLAGSCLAYLTLFKSTSLTWARNRSNLFSAIGFLLIIGTVAFLPKELAFPGWWAALPVLGAVLLIATGSNSWISQKILSNRVLVWFGLISFPLYLWHWPLLTFAKLLNDHSKYPKMIAIVLAIFLAWISYQYIEKPIRYGKNLALKSIVLVGIMLLVAVLGLVVFQSAGFENRIDDGQGVRLAKQYRSQLEWLETYNHSEACRALFGGDFYCLIGDANKPVTAAILGDSHANAFFPGLETYFRNTGGNLALLGSAGCPPFLGVEWTPKPPLIHPNCYARTAGIYQKVLEDKNIGIVMIAFHHNMPFNPDYRFEDKLQELTLGDSYQATVDALTRTINMFEGKGKKVILIYDTPDITIDIKNCAFNRPYLPPKNKCNVDQNSFVQDFETYDKMIAAVKKNTNVEVFDTRPFIKGNFPIDADGNLNYRDSTHLSYKGSLFFSDKYNFNK